MSTGGSCVKDLGWGLFLLIMAVAVGCVRSSEKGVSGEAQSQGMAISDRGEVVADFGVMRPSDSAKMLVKVSNPNPAEVTITKFEAGCGCTVATIDDPTIPALGSGRIEVTFHAGSETADYSRYIYVNCNTGPFAKIKVLAKVRRELQILPPHLFRTISAGDVSREVSAAILVLNYTDSDWSSIRVSSPDSWVEIGQPVITEVDAAQNQNVRQAWRVNLGLKQAASLNPGVHKSLLSVVDLPSRGNEQHVPLHVTVRTPYVVLPQNVVFRADEYRRTKKIVISGIEPDGDGSDEGGITARILSDRSPALVRLSEVKREGKQFVVDISRTEVPAEKQTTVTIEVLLNRNMEVIGRVEVLIL